MSGVPLTCPDCLAFWLANPGLAASLTSYGIERGQATDRVARAYFAEFHAGGHVAATPPWRAAGEDTP